MAITAWRRLWFIRHAETGLAGTFCGQADPPLNDRGRAQLAGLVKRLEPYPLTGLCTSKLLRARETAEAIAFSRGLPVTEFDGLREIGFGAWEGLTWEQIEQRDVVYARRWVSEFPALPTPGGEPIGSFRGRVLATLDQMRELEQGDVAVVTHAGVLRVLLESFGHYAPHHAWERTREYGCVIGCTQSAAGARIEVAP